MYHSIETRLPFLDYRLVELGVSISSEHKIHKGWTKYPIRATLNGLLPESVVWRKNKFGFEAPVHTWLNGIRELMKRDISNSELVSKITHSKKVITDFESLSLKNKWMLFNLARWEQEFNVVL